MRHLRKCSYNVSAVSWHLDITRMVMRYRMKRHGIAARHYGNQSELSLPLALIRLYYLSKLKPRVTERLGLSVVRDLKREHDGPANRARARSGDI